MSIRQLLSRLVRRHDPGWDQGLDFPTQTCRGQSRAGRDPAANHPPRQEQKALREQIMKFEAEVGLARTDEAQLKRAAAWLVLICREHCLLWGEWLKSAALPKQPTPAARTSPRSLCVGVWH